LKLLLYAHDWAPSVGGVQTVTMSLARGFAAWEKSHPGEAIDVTVVTQSPAGAMDDAALPFRVIRQPRTRELLRLARAADVIHLAGPSLVPMAIARLVGKPVFVEHHGYQAICPNGLLFREPSRTACPGYFAQKKYAKCLRCTSHTMGSFGGVRWTLLTFVRRWLCTAMTANIMITNHVSARLDLPRSRLVYHGVEEPAITATNPASPREARLRLAAVGRLVAEKGLPLLLQAAQKLKDEGAALHISFIGDGAERQQLEELTDTLGLRDFVQFTGDLRGLDLERAVAGIDVVVMPSIWEETAGLAAIEQMMRGRVVIAADIGGLGEIVGLAGLKFVPGDAEALASCVRKLIADPSLIQSLGSAARARALEFFTQDRMIHNHLSLYHDHLGL
jgi:glycogen synthase